MKTHRLLLPLVATVALSAVAALTAFTFHLMQQYGPTGEYRMGGDWETFRLAGRNLLSGRSPYEQYTFFNPPWALLPVLPLTVLPPMTGAVIMFTLSTVTYAYIGFRFKLAPWILVLFLVGLGPLYVGWRGNIDALVALGFVLPPPLGIFFVLAKPQVGLCAAAFWVIAAWRAGGVGKAVRLAAPVTVAFALSFLVFGNYVAQSDRLTTTWAWWNRSAWPNGIPIGIALLALSLWQKDLRLAIAASPFFAPYVGDTGWIVTWLGLLAVVGDRPQYGFENPR